MQHERGPRNSTIRRQMALYLKEPEVIANIVPPAVTALDLALPKPSAESRVSIAAPSIHPPLPHPVYCNALAMSKVKLEYLPPHNIAKSGKITIDFLHQFPLNMANFSTISLMPAITSESICEQAARILFFNVHWTRDLVTGANLTLEDQLTLLESSWRELFLLAAAQLMPTLDPTPLLPPTPHGIELAVEVNRFRETLAGFHGMSLDFQEFSYIRAIVHFKAGLDCEPMPGSRNGSGTNSPSVVSRLRNPAAVTRLRDSAQLALGQRLSGASYGALRFGKVLLLLPSLRSVSADTIAELFFKSTIGAIPIERIICDMYRGV